MHGRSRPPLESITSPSKRICYCKLVIYWETVMNNGDWDEMQIPRLSTGVLQRCPDLYILFSSFKTTCLVQTNTRCSWLWLKMIIPNNRESNYVLNVFQNKCNIMFLLYRAALVALLSDTLIFFRGLFRTCITITCISFALTSRHFQFRKAFLFNSSHIHPI